MGKLINKSYVCLPAVLLVACATSNTERDKNLQYVVRGEMPYVESRFQECYQMQAEKDSNLQGKLRIKFSVGADGKPTDFGVLKKALSGSEAGQKELLSCVKDVLLASQFSNMESLGDDHFEVQYPVTFR